MKKHSAPSYTVRELAALLDVQLDVQLDGALETLLHRVNTIEEAQSGELSFLANPKYTSFVASTQASALIVQTDFVAPTTYKGALLRADDPYMTFLQAIKIFYPFSSKQSPGRHSSSVVAESASVDVSVRIGANAVIGERCVIGANTIIEAGVILYDDVHIGEGTTLHANVVCYDRTVIGSRCILHAGVVLGADGFGFAENKDDGSFTKIPQVGNVIIGDDVEIGANCTIDRAALGSTRIGNGVKLDNLIHVAHNVVIGEHTAIAAQAGISGSTKLGKRNRIAGQVGFVGHIATVDDVTVYAQSGVAKDIDDKGIHFGSPAKPLMDELRLQAALKQLPEFIRRSSK